MGRVVLSTELPRALGKVYKDFGDLICTMGRELLMLHIIEFYPGIQLLRC
jgi:hypothetical protein